VFISTRRLPRATARRTREIDMTLDGFRQQRRERFGGANGRGIRAVNPREAQLAIWRDFFRFRTFEINGFWPRFVTRLDPIDDPRADRHALRERHDRITQMRRR